MTNSLYICHRKIPTFLQLFNVLFFLERIISTLSYFFSANPETLDVSLYDVSIGCLFLQNNRQSVDMS